MSITYSNQELVLKLLNKAINDNLIFEKTSIKHFKDGKRVLHKDTKKIKLHTKKTITKIRLENKKILLIEDYPINQLLSYSILLNPITQLYEFRLKQDLETYIATKKVKELFELDNDKKNQENKTRIYKIESITLKQIIPKEIMGMKFEYEFSQPNKIVKIKEYILSTKQFNTNIISQAPEYIPGLQNFTPTLKNTHFKLAKELNIPIIPLIKNEFIIDDEDKDYKNEIDNDKNYIENNTNYEKSNKNNSNINIFDINKIIQIIKPFRIIEEKIQVPVHKKTLKRTYLDVSTTYHMKIDTKLLIDKIKYSQITSEPKEKIIHSVKNLTQTEITKNFGEYEIPLWKIHSKQNFIKIQDYKDFKEITGINFPKTNENMNNIYIQDETGEIGFLKHQYIKDRFQKTFETLSDNNIIIYQKPLDLAIKAIMDENISIIIKYEKVSDKQVNKIYEYVKNLVEITIIETIKYNKLPRKIPNQYNPSYNEKYFSSLAIKLENDFNIFLKKPKKTNLIHKLNNELKTLNKYIITQRIEHNEIFYFCQIIYQSLKILKIFDNEKYTELKKRFNQYFNIDIYNIDDNELKLTNHSKDYKFVKQIFLINKYVKKKDNKDNNLLIIEKKQFNKILLNTSNIENKIKIQTTEPQYKTYIKPNIRYLKSQFKYKYRDISKQIKKLENINNDTKIDIGINKTTIKKEFLNYHKVYDNYKIICENKYFSFLKYKNIDTKN